MRIKDGSFFKNSRPWAIILLIVLTFAVYANSLKNSFVVDDHFVIVYNDFVKSWKNFPLIFSRAYLPAGSVQDFFTFRDTGSGQVTYRPVITAFHFIDYSLWGLNPFGYHLTNIILHIVNVILLYFFIALITKDNKVSWLGSLLFALHPVNSEPVNAIAFRGDLLVFLFYISSFSLFIRSDYYKGRKRSFCYIGSIILFLLALFSKESAITLPLLLIIYDYYFVFDGKLRKTLSHFRSRYTGYIAASLFYLFIWGFFISKVLKLLSKAAPDSNFYINLLNVPKAVVTYIRWLAMPTEIHVTLQDPSFFSHSFFTPEILFSISVIVACFVLVLILYRRSRLISFAILWFFITLLPSLNIVPAMEINTIASRYLYIPAVGFCLLVAVLLCRLPALKISFFQPHILQRAAAHIVIVLVLFYSAFTVIRSLAWRDNATFWADAAEHYPHIAIAHAKLGNCYMIKGLLDKAISRYKTAMSLDPSHGELYFWLGLCYHKKGFLDEAIGEFKKALKLNPNSPDLYVSLGVVFEEKGQYKEAIGCLEEAIRINPDCIEAYNNLGVTYARMKDYVQAKKAWERALEIDPEYKDARDNLEKLRELSIDKKLTSHLQKNENERQIFFKE